MKRREREGKKKEWALFALHLHTHTKFTCIVGERVTLRDREGERRGGKEKVHLSLSLLFRTKDKEMKVEEKERKKKKREFFFLFSCHSTY